MAKVAPSSMLSNISGSFGSAVIVNSRTGLVLRGKPVYKRPTSDGQRQAMDRVKAVSPLWKTMTIAQAQAWERFAARSERVNRVSGQSYRSAGYHAFVRLAVKVLQVNPEAAVPPTPPEQDFLGDGMVIQASASPGLEVSDDMPQGLMPILTPGEESASILFSAPAPNSPGTVTELLLQPLPSLSRKPGQQFKSFAFHHFSDEEPVAEVPVEPGIYVPAYRFVDAATGQSDLLMVLPTLIAGELRAAGCRCSGCGRG